MSSSVEKTSETTALLTGQKVVYAGIAWAVTSLLFFLLFSISSPGEDRPFWYKIGTLVLELLPFLAAACLCYRNWRSPNIASGRNVWLGIGLGMICYFLGGFIFGLWEVGWGLNADISPADLFYFLAYSFIGWGMVLAILPRRLNLETWQWLTVVAIAILGIALAVLVYWSTPDKKQADTTSPTTTEQATASGTSKASASPTAPAIKDSSLPDAATPKAEDNKKNPPAWALAIEETLKPYAEGVNLSYIIGDVFLLIIAATLLLAFWGGRFVQSWRMIAAATLSLYIADMWTKYAESDPNYESGGLLDVFFIFSGLLFAIGAALEFDISIRTRRGGRKRTEGRS